MLSRLYGNGVPIAERHKQAIRISGLEVDEPGTRDTTAVATDGRGHLWLFDKQAEAARKRPAPDTQEKAESYMGRIPKEWVEKWKNKEIDASDWKPSHVDKHDDEFRRFIKSHIPRFDRIIPYERFFLHVEQARRWLDEGTTIEDFSGEEQRQYGEREMERIAANRLYGMEKYGWIKDDSIPGGKRKYHASTPQALIIFLLDCGHSLEIGKGRQAAITSTVMLYEIMTMIVKASYKGVLVTDDVEFTGKAIFNEKLKASFLYVRDRNSWMCPPAIGNWADKNIVFDWSEAKTKDQKKMVSSQYTLAASDDTQTINGTTPSKVVFDEAQNIPTYVAIKLEARPTMLATLEDGTMRIARQIVAYGTGSSHQRGKGVFENEYKGTINNWNVGKDTSSFVPLFLDWTCRPYMTTFRYQEEYAFYLTTDKGVMAGAGKEERIAQFRAAYPSKVEDMFLTSHRTIIPQILVSKHQDRILNECHAKGLAPQPGYFEPIYDMGKPNPPGSYVPYYVRDAKWIPSRPDDEEAPCLMLLDRVSGWVRRYVKGTDPIQNPTGVSKFASLVIDRAGNIQEIEGQRCFSPVVACTLNWRNPVVEENFFQSALMNLYYSNHGQRGCMEVLEFNQGQAYEAFMRSKVIDLERSLWLRMAMPQRYRGGGHSYGLVLKAGNKQALFTDVRNGFLDMGNGIWHYELFNQIYNVVVEERRSNDGITGMAYYPRNKNADNDDLLDAFGFALISSELERLDPMEVGVDKPLTRKQRVWDRQGLTLVERFIDVPVKL